MYCPFRIKSKTVNFVHANESCTNQGFEHCLDEECAAFYDGICLRLNPPEYTISKRLTDKELQTIKNEMLSAGQIMLVSADPGSVEIIPQWIPVTERLPDIAQNVLMYFREGKTFAAGFLSEVKGRSPLWCSFTDAEWFTECDNRPDYWMPMPEPPKEVQK